MIKDYFRINRLLYQNMNKAYLLLGGNMGNRLANLTTAMQFLEKKVGRIVKSSSIYETASWGNTNQHDFLNQVLLIETELTAEQIMAQILLIENEMGRVRTEKNASRIIDIDILFLMMRLLKQKISLFHILKFKTGILHCIP